jgi:hypothetical protein
MCAGATLRLTRARPSTSRPGGLSRDSLVGTTESHRLLLRDWRPIRKRLCVHQSRQSRRRDLVTPVWLA